MRRIVPLTLNRSLIAAYSLARPRRRDWVVHLTESGAEFQPGSRADLKALIGPRAAAQFNYLVVNKPGLLPKGKDRSAFEASFRRSLRIDDTLATMRAVIPATDRIYLIGYSEGAYLAPEVAVRDRRVKAVVMVGGGTRGWLKEELGNAVGAREKAALLRQISTIQRQRGDSKKRWHGFSYATWNSYRADSTLAALRRLRVPALSVLGDRDTVIDLEWTLSDLISLSNVRVEVLPGRGHELASDWPSVRPLLADFLTSPK